MPLIEVEGLTKTFRTYKKQPGFAGALQGLFHRNYEQTVAVKDVSFSVEEGELVFGLDPPRDLEPVLSILHTGVRALLSGRRWWGSTAANGKRPRVVILEPAALIPAGITLLSVEGDQRWDRIDPASRSGSPGLFATEKIPQRTRN